MTVPYATVILPTVNRASTLPFALASIQQQSEALLDILIVLDGATARCREVAETAACADERIRVLDLPKGPRDGSHSINHALSQAAAERVFYIDDDDLWLPCHVARLGPLLDRADVADSRVCSVDRRGRLHLGPCRGAGRRARELLATGRLKSIYDTHLAHRKDIYGRSSHWHVGQFGSGVWDFFAGLARDPGCGWASCDAVTALSIHGAARGDMTIEDRAAELAHWLQRLGEVPAMLLKADSVFHLFRLLMADRPNGETFENYCAAHDCYGDVLSRGLTHPLFGLFSAAAPCKEDALALAAALSEAVESGYMFESIALALFEAYGPEQHERILQELARGEGGAIAGRLAAYSVALARRDLLLAHHVAQAALAVGPDPAGSLGRWCEKVAGFLRASEIAPAGSHSS